MCCLFVLSFIFLVILLVVHLDLVFINCVVSWVIFQRIILFSSLLPEPMILVNIAAVVVLLSRSGIMGDDNEDGMRGATVAVLLDQAG